jgi:hypothetical protein
MVGETVSGMARCPYDPRHANVALFAGTGVSRFLFLLSLSFNILESNDVALFTGSVKCPGESIHMTNQSRD